MMGSSITVHTAGARVRRGLLLRCSAKTHSGTSVRKHGILQVANGMHG